MLQVHVNAYNDSLNTHTWRARHEQDALLGTVVGRVGCAADAALRPPRLAPAEDSVVPGAQPPHHIAIDLLVAEQVQEAAWPVLVYPRVIRYTYCTDKSSLEQSSGLNAMLTC